MENKKIFFSKRGSYILGKKPAYFIICLFFLTFSFLIFGFIIKSQLSSTTTFPDNLETTILINRFLNSPECFAYQDKEIDRTYLGVIDLEKFNKKNLEKCYFTDDNNLKAFKLTLKSPDIQIKDNNVFTSNWDTRRSTQTSQYIIIHDKGTFYRGTVLIAIQK